MRSVYLTYVLDKLESQVEAPKICHCFNFRFGMNCVSKKKPPPCQGNRVEWKRAKALGSEGFLTQCQILGYESGFAVRQLKVNS